VDRRAVAKDEADEVVGGAENDALVTTLKSLPLLENGGGGPMHLSSNPCRASRSHHHQSLLRSNGCAT
jgi:hypothetical protein